MNIIDGDDNLDIGSFDDSGDDFTPDNFFPLDEVIPSGVTIPKELRDALANSYVFFNLNGEAPYVSVAVSNNDNTVEVNVDILDNGKLHLFANKDLTTMAKEIVHFDESGECDN